MVVVVDGIVVVVSYIGWSDAMRRVARDPITKQLVVVVSKQLGGCKPYKEQVYARPEFVLQIGIDYYVVDVMIIVMIGMVVVGWKGDGFPCDCSHLYYQSHLGWYPI